MEGLMYGLKEAVEAMCGPCMGMVRKCWRREPVVTDDRMSVSELQLRWEYGGSGGMEEKLGGRRPESCTE